MLTNVNIFHLCLVSNKNVEEGKIEIFIEIDDNIDLDFKVDHVDQCKK